MKEANCLRTTQGTRALWGPEGLALLGAHQDQENSLPLLHTEDTCSF